MKILSLFSKESFVCECLNLPYPLEHTRSLTASLGHSCFSKSPWFARPFLLIHLSPCCPSPVTFNRIFWAGRDPQGSSNPTLKWMACMEMKPTTLVLFLALLEYTHKTIQSSCLQVLSCCWIILSAVYLLQMVWATLTRLCNPSTLWPFASTLSFAMARTPNIFRRAMCHL